MEQVFVVQYDKLEVGRNECYATDAEVLGVFLQRSNANRRAREKAVEIRRRFDYFAESEDPLTNTDDENDFSWDGTRPDDVGRTIEDRVYVSRHAIEDPSPTKKRARTATDAGDMTFEAAEPFLAAMKQGELVAAIAILVELGTNLRRCAASWTLLRQTCGAGHPTSARCWRTIGWRTRYRDTATAVPFFSRTPCGLVR